MSETKVSRILTRETVEENDPCYEYGSKFAECFPESVEVTVELAVSQAGDWDWHWAAQRLLSFAGKRAWLKLMDVAEAKYNNTTKPYSETQSAAWDEYYAVRDEAIRVAHRLGLNWEEREALVNKASKGLVEAPAAALRAVREVAKMQLNEARAEAWAEIFISETDEQLPVPAKCENNEDDEPCDCGGCRSW